MEGGRKYKRETLIGYSIECGICEEKHRHGKKNTLEEKTRKTISGWVGGSIYLNKQEATKKEGGSPTPKVAPSKNAPTSRGFCSANPQLLSI